MRPVKVTVTGTGSTTSSVMVVLDDKQAPFNVGIGCVLSAGAATYSIQHTFDDVQDAAVTPIWFNNSGITSKSANADGNYSSPVRAARLTVESGTGTVYAIFLQSDR